MVPQWYFIPLPYSLKVVYETQPRNILVFCSQNHPPLFLPCTCPRGWCSAKERTWHHNDSLQDQDPVIPCSFASNFPVLAGVANALTVNAQKRSAEQYPGFSQNLCDMTGAPRKCPQSPDLSTSSSCERCWGNLSSTHGSELANTGDLLCSPFFRHSNSLNCLKKKKISAHKWVLQKECEQGKQKWCFPPECSSSLEAF